MLNASGVEERRDDAADANIHILRMIVAEDTGNGMKRRSIFFLVYNCIYL